MDAPSLEEKPTSGKPPRLLDRVVERIRVKHYSLRTEEAYLHWIKRFILFHGKHHPAEMGGVEVEAFLSALAVERNVAASAESRGQVLSFAFENNNPPIFD